MATPIAEGTVPWPDEFVRRYLAAGYWQGRPLGALLHEAADGRPDHVALVDGLVQQRVQRAALPVSGGEVAADELIRPGDGALSDRRGHLDPPVRR